MQPNNSLERTGDLATEARENRDAGSWKAYMRERSPAAQLAAVRLQLRQDCL